MSTNDPTPRKNVDLRRLPGWLQAVIAAMATIGVMLVAYRLGSTSPSDVGIWLQRNAWVIGVIYLIALGVIFYRWYMRQKR